MTLCFYTHYFANFALVQHWAVLVALPYLVAGQPNGISHKPNAQGFGTLLHHRAMQTCVVGLFALAGFHRRRFYSALLPDANGEGEYRIFKSGGSNSLLSWFSPFGKWEVLLFSR